MTNHNQLSFASLPFETQPPPQRKPLLGVAQILVGNALTAAAFLGGGLCANGILGLVIAAVGGEHTYRFIVDGPVEFIGDEKLLQQVLANDASIAFVSVLAIIAGALLAIAGVSRGGRLRAHGRRLRARDGRTLLRHAARAPVLLLRSFDDDLLADPRPLDFFALRYEERLAHAVVRAGPLLGIGRPDENVGFSGAARIYVRDEDWRTAVRFVMQHAAAVLIVVGPTQGLWWEIETALQSIPHERLLFFFPFVYEPREPRSSLGAYMEFIGRWNLPKRRYQRMQQQRLQRYQTFLSRTKLVRTLPEDLGDALFLDFAPGASPRLLPTRYRWFGFWNFMHVLLLPKRYRVLAFDMRRTLVPFVRKVKRQAA